MAHPPPPLPDEAPPPLPDDDEHGGDWTPAVSEGARRSEAPSTRSHKTSRRDPASLRSQRSEYSAVSEYNSEVLRKVDTYAGNNVGYVLRDVRRVEMADPRLALAHIALAYKQTIEETDGQGLFLYTLEPLLQAVCGRSLVVGSGLNRRRVSPERFLRGDARRYRALREAFEQGLDAGNGMVRRFLTQLTLLMGLNFYYQVEAEQVVTMAQLGHLEAETWSKSETSRVERVLESLARATAGQQTAAELHEIMSTFIGEHEHSVLMCNDSAAALFGYTAAELMHMSIHELTPPAVRPTHHERVEAFFRNPPGDGQALGRILTGHHKDGHALVLAISLEIIDSGSERLTLARVRDNSRWEELRAELGRLLARTVEAVDEADEASARELMLRGGAPLLLVDESSRIVDASGEAAALFGAESPAELTRHKIHDLVDPKVARRHQMFVRAFFTGDSSLDFTNRQVLMRTLDGRQQRVLLKLKRVTQRERPLALAEVHPVTDAGAPNWALAERELARATARMQAARDEQQRIVDLFVEEQLFPEAGTHPCFVVNDVGCLTHVSPELAAVFGYTVDELRFRPVDVLTPEWLRDRHYGYVKSFFANPGIIGRNGRLVSGAHKDGHEVRAVMSLSLYELPSGPATLGVLEVIEEAQQRVEALRADLESVAAQRRRAEDAKLQAFLQQAGHPGLLCDEAGTILYHNAELAELSGYTTEELVGQDVSMLTPNHVRASHHKKILVYFADPLARSMDTTNEGAPFHMQLIDGSLVPVRITLSQVDTRHGRLASCVLVDISQVRHRKQLVAEEEEALEQAHIESKESVRQLGHRMPWLQHVSTE